jgi:hypothetical protein
VSEAIKLAACLHSIYYTGSADFPRDQTPWYRPYVDYALENGIISGEYPNYEAYATRAQFAVIFAAALPDEALTVMNDVELGAIPDVSYSYSYGPSVYLLYRAGITVGKDSAGTFYPNDTIKRSEVATIAARMANTSYRLPVSLTVQSLSPEEISALCSPAVFYIELYNINGTAYASGSGFFIDSSVLP